MRAHIPQNVKIWIIDDLCVMEREELTWRRRSSTWSVATSPPIFNTTTSGNFSLLNLGILGRFRESGDFFLMGINDLDRRYRFIFYYVCVTLIKRRKFMTLYTQLLSILLQQFLVIRRRQSCHRCTESTDFCDLVTVFVSCRRLFAVGVVKAHVV